MDKVNSFGLIKALIMEISSKTIFTDKVSINGLMVVSTTDSGWTTRWRAKALSPGAMVVDTKATTRMIKSTGTEPSSGPMAGNISASGAKANSTEKEFTSKRARRDKESGRWARGLSGSKILPTSD